MMLSPDGGIRKNIKRCTLSTTTTGAIFPECTLDAPVLRGIAGDITGVYDYRVWCGFVRFRLGYQL